MLERWHSLWAGLGLALRNLALHKLRSLLTVLGLVFGVASVIIMLAVAEGASLDAQKQIEQLGATNIILRSTKPIEDPKKAGGNDDEDFVLVYGLTYDDLERVTQTVPSIVSATPLREFRQPVRYLDRELEGRVVGATPEYQAMNGLVLRQGRFFQPIDLEGFANLCVLGAELAEKLFPYSDPVGKSVRLGNSHYYRVIGVMEFKMPTAGIGGSLTAQDFNRDVYIPISTDRARFGEMLSYQGQGSMSFERIELTQITAQCRDLESVKPTAAVLEGLLAQYHAKKDYSITVPLALLEQAERTKRLFNIVLGSIASISLLVGGIGIMNIMLATVTERTREIGIRRALGAKRRDITRQFLIETGVLSATGGLIGVAVGLAVPPLVGRFTGLTPIVTPLAPVAAFAVALIVGVTFGLYPARRAARMDPVEALRAE